MLRKIHKKFDQARIFYHGGKISVDRLAGLSDGFIAIIITLMVLEIPIPSTVEMSEISNFARAILIYFASFVIVGLQWNRHHHVLDRVKEVGNSFIWKNLIFLFSLSLIPLLMKWMIHNPAATVPALLYAFAYIFTDFCMRWIFISSTGHKAGFFHRPDEDLNRKFHFWRLLMNIAAIVVVILISFISPQIEVFFLVLMPVILSLFNIFSDEEENSKS